MRLVRHENAGRYRPTQDLVSDHVPPYAIFSYTWGPEGVVFADLAKAGADWQHNAGYEMIRFFAEPARQQYHKVRHLGRQLFERADDLRMLGLGKSSSRLRPLVSIRKNERCWRQDDFRAFNT